MYGNLELNGKIYPFFLQNQTVHIVQQAFQYRDEICIKERMPLIKGVTCDNRDILFLNCDFNIGFCEITFSIHGYIISKGNLIDVSDGFSFDRLTFYSEALNVFYSPQKAANTQVGDEADSFDHWDGSMQITINPFSKTDISFQFKDANCVLNIARYRNVKRGTSSIGDLKTSLAFSFAESKPPEVVCEYYLYVLDFLTFVSFSKNIPFERIVLSKKRDDKDNQYIEIGQAIIFSNASTYDKTVFNSITLDSLPNDKFGIIFNQIATLRERDYRIHLYFPSNAKESRYVDHSKWLMKAICFEGLFQFIYPEFKTNTKESFQRAKTSILQAIEEYGDYEKLSKTEQKYYKKCKQQIVHYEGILEEKFNYVYNKHISELSGVLTSIESSVSISRKANYGAIYQEFRNKMAHG